MQKTALAELIKYAKSLTVEKNSKLYKDNWEYSDGNNDAILEIITKAENLLPKERGNMECLAANVLFDEGYTKIDSVNKRAASHFDKTFTQNIE